ncbi:hypothetical protein R3P38DRAFT_3223285 [Favolaschia claudopus]|uniref:Uncharacterized protein n=1 Tax=Favolaschia claudopus TaxID=2862362 RepID=A0AAV9ZYD2_9AGAR
MAQEQQSDTASQGTQAVFCFEWRKRRSAASHTALGSSTTDADTNVAIEQDQSDIGPNLEPSGCDLAVELKRRIDLQQSGIKAIRKEVADVQRYGAEISAELKNLSDDHSADMEMLREDVLSNVLKFGALVDTEMKSLGEKHRSELLTLKEEMTKSIREGVKSLFVAEMQVLRDEMTADIAKLADEFERRTQRIEERVKTERAENKKTRRSLVQQMRARVCYWKPIITDETFRSKAIYPPPIEAGDRDTRSYFVGRWQNNKSSCYVTGIKEGRSWDSGDKFWVLVGYESLLEWVECSGRFKVDEMDCEPVPAWDEDSDNVQNTMYIARFVDDGEDYFTDVTDRQNGVSKRVNKVTLKSQEYEVLCYKDCDSD